MTQEPNSNWSQDDQDWLDLLAGRNVNNAAPTTRHEADLLRQTIMARRTAVDNIEPEAELLSDQELDYAWQRMRFRLPKATQEQQQSATKPLRQRRSTLVVMALAATLAGVIIAPELLFSPQPETAVKGFIQPQLLNSATPERTAQAIASALVAQGLDPQIKQQDDKWVVEAQLPASTTALEQVLQRFSLTVPPQQQLVIWVTQSE